MLSQLAYRRAEGCLGLSRLMSAQEKKTSRHRWGFSHNLLNFEIHAKCRTSQQGYLALVDIQFS
jgi:hypothetical protein